MSKSHATIDLETSIKNRGEEAIGKNKAAPWHLKNRIVMMGIKMENDTTYVKNYPSRSTITPSTGSVDVLIGHNIKFDCHYMMRDSVEFRDTFHLFDVWDTQLAEYLLSGQTHLYPKLDDCSKKYGGTLKDDRIKDYWDNGIDTEDIPEDQLEEYLIHDVENTELVFYAQLQRAVDMDMLPLIKSQMRALQATIEMEFNGMHFDKNHATELADEYEVELASNMLEISGAMSTAGIEDINPLSAKQLGLLLFGGDMKYKEDEVVLDEDGLPYKYKSGKRKDEVKTKKVEKTKYITGLFDGEGEKTESGRWKVDDDAVSKLPVSDITRAIKEARRLQKDISTYYRGYSNFVWPDGIIHHSLNHCATGTGRLSSTQPNFQNVSSTE